ncbi:MAG: hypothetical protein IJX94_06070 [Clostridia bacterium]|nr:hypothetical protein [Clostridia bacterium]
MKLIKRILALALALILTLTCFAGCSSKGKTMMELGDVEMSVNLFQLYLSRMKGTLCSSYYFGSQALKESFWDTVMNTDGTTYNKFYTESVLNSAKTYLAALHVFEERDLKLPESYVDEIDAEMERLVNEYANGSKKQFNAILADYGVNYKILREAYIIEAKIEYLNDTLFGANGSLISPNLVEDYYQQTYRRFKQVFLYTYDYVYVEDEKGDDIYYRADGRIAYDTEKGTKKTDANGDPVYDSNGDIIHIFMDEKGITRIAYDTEKGERKIKTDENGNGLIDYLPDNELQQVEYDAVQIMEMAKTGNFDGFDALVSKYNEDEGMNQYPNGYYLTATTDYDSPEVVEKLFEMEVGEVAKVSSEYGIHIIMRYETEERAYTKTENSDFFISTETGLYVFMEDMKKSLLADYLEQFKANIVVDEALLATADIKRIGANFYY